MKLSTSVFLTVCQAAPSLENWLQDGTEPPFEALKQLVEESGKTEEKSWWDEKQAETGDKDWEELFPKIKEEFDSIPDEEKAAHGFEKYKNKAKYYEEKYGSNPEMKKMWEGKMEFFSQMKEHMGDIDWKAFAENMPWEKISEKMDKIASGEWSMESWSEKKAEMKTKMMETMLNANQALFQIRANDPAQRAMIDKLAEVTKELPSSTTCASMADSIYMWMIDELTESLVSDDVWMPNEIVDKMWAKLTPKLKSSKGHSSVVYLNRTSERMSRPAVGTVIGKRMVLTGLDACYSDVTLEKVEKWADYIGVEKFHEHLMWGSNENIFNNYNQFYMRFPKPAEGMSVLIDGKEHFPTGAMKIPSTKTRADLSDHFPFTDAQDVYENYVKVAPAARCLLFFDEKLPVMPACNPMDDGQIGRAKVMITHEFAQKNNLVLGQMPPGFEDPEEAAMIGKAYQQIIDKRFWNKVAEMETPCIHKEPKQCFMVSYCNWSKGMKSIPVDLVLGEDCINKYGEQRCKEESFATFEWDQSWGLPAVSAPLLCAENGSVTLRGTFESLDEEGVANFKGHDNNLLEMLAIKDMEALYSN